MKSLWCNNNIEGRLRNYAAWKAINFDNMYSKLMRIIISFDSDVNICHACVRSETNF